MKLPDLSHLQSLVIEALGTEKITGRELRSRLQSAGAKKSGPAFYQLMSRLEECELVTGEYTQKIVEGQIIKERVYEVTANGRRALQRSFDFYNNLGARSGNPSYA